MARITLAFRTEENYEVHFSLRYRRIEWINDSKCEWRYFRPGDDMGTSCWTAFKNWREAIAWRI